MNTTNHKAALLLGGNLGDVNKTFTSVSYSLSSLGRVISKSSVYLTAAWGMDDAPDFLNQVILIETKMEPGELLEGILMLEQEFGRTRSTDKGGYHSRVLDIDILTFDDMIINEPNLKVPHPKMHLRNFTLIPLKEVMPGWVHPVSRKSIDQLIRESEDPLEVKKL